MVNATQVAGDQVIRIGGVALVSSKTTIGGWHEVRDVGGVLVCDCVSHTYRGHCRHIAAVVTVERAARPDVQAPRSWAQISAATRRLLATFED